MSRGAALFLLGLCCASAASADSTKEPMIRFHSEIEVSSTLSLLHPVAATQAVFIQFPVGELEIQAADTTDVRTELKVACSRLSESLCAKYKSRLRLAATVVDDTVEVRLQGLPKRKLRKLQLDGQVVFPRWAPLAVQVGIGDVDIQSGSRDLSVRMGIGDLSVTAPRERVGSVLASTRIGDAGLRQSDETLGSRHNLLGAQVEWFEGEGAAQIAIGLKIGDAQVVLE